MLSAWILAITAGVVMHLLDFNVDDLFLGVILIFTLTLMVHVFILKKEFDS